MLEILKEAEAILITAGAGMGVDSGLPDFRGNEGFWKAYPVIKDLGYSFSEMANPEWFDKKPELAWAFYGHRLNLYRDTVPHEGFQLLLDLVKEKNDNYFVYTSNVDGQFQKAGFNPDKICEIHGSIQHFQCTDNECNHDVWFSNDEIKINMEKFESLNLLYCKHCGKIARPNILMFYDWNWISTRTNEQEKRYIEWYSKNKNKKIVIIEIGAGSVIPTIRNLGDKLSRSNPNTSLIRINPREYKVSGFNVEVPMGGLDGIRQILGK